MNKNPFEVRLDVLKMSQDMLETEYRSRQLKFQEKIKVMKEDESITTDQLLDFIDKNAPVPYNDTEVVARSSNFYNFVSTSTGSNSLTKK